MPGLSTHRLTIDPTFKPVKQTARYFSNVIQLQIKKEIEKILDAGFIKPCMHTVWLANIVPVRKKNGQIRVCVDFRDLNNACPKDDFPLSNLDMIIDTTANHEMFSFMNGFSDYNQIKMDSKDAEMTTFRTPFVNFYYTVLPFGLKNARTTYQRVMTVIFHDIIHDCVEDYVDDLVVKSTKKEDHLRHLRKVSERYRKYDLKMNQLKCAFGVSEGKFLGFSVDKEGIKVDHDKVKAILAMEPPRNLTQIREFIGKISYLRRFIPALASLIRPFHQLTKKGVDYCGNWILWISSIYDFYNIQFFRIRFYLFLIFSDCCLLYLFFPVLIYSKIGRLFAYIIMIFSRL